MFQQKNCSVDRMGQVLQRISKNINGPLGWDFFSSVFFFKGNRLFPDSDPEVTTIKGSNPPRWSNYQLGLRTCPICEEYSIFLSSLRKRAIFFSNGFESNLSPTFRFSKQRFFKASGKFLMKNYTCQVWSFKMVIVTMFREINCGNS